jgi:hypothetical protein
LRAKTISKSKYTVEFNKKIYYNNKSLGLDLDLHFIVIGCPTSSRPNRSAFRFTRNYLIDQDLPLLVATMSSNSTATRDGSISTATTMIKMAAPLTRHPMKITIAIALAQNQNQTTRATTMTNFRKSSGDQRTMNKMIMLLILFTMGESVLI